VAAAFVLSVGLSLSLFDPRNGSELIEGFLKKVKQEKQNVKRSITAKGFVIYIRSVIGEISRLSAHLIV
jgi:hypothetical protein